jgi:hypothetical protein
MSQEENPEGEVKRTSKLTAMIGSENDDFNGLQVSVYYSENNWETCEEVNLILDENTTINQLIDSAIYKFKNELFYDNIDKKQFNVMLFKKKKKVPNEEYPACNPESRVKDYGKDNFCLVEDTERKKNEEKKEEKIEEVKQEENKDNDKSNDNKKTNKDDTIDDQEEEINNMYKTCSPKCTSCLIF